MSVHTVRLPDVGEGVAEAELVEWCVAVGDAITPDEPIAEVLTDKATVQIYSPVAGVVQALHGTPGDLLAVGADIALIATGDTGERAEPPASVNDGPQLSGPSQHRSEEGGDGGRHGARVLAAPAVRQRARDLGIDLAAVSGSGPDGRVTHGDLDRVLLAAGPGEAARPAPARDAVRVEPVRGLRRRIAERLTDAWTQIPHITYVDEVDVTDLEALRAELNGRAQPGAARLTVLPFVLRAIVIACAEQPRLNAHYDAAAGTLTVFDAVHVGIATQTPDGLVVPVLRDAGSRHLGETAAEVARLATAARDGTATRNELSGSTITVTSLGALGGLVTTPILNAPEVAIVGVNKMEQRPVVRDGSVVVRTMLNLSCSFDHRIVDGWDAATFVQRIARLLEMPALLFVDDPA